MTAPQTTDTNETPAAPGTAVATRPARELSPEAQAARARNAIVAQIRGQLWAKDASPEIVRYVAEYCRLNNLDAVRHVELLGGRIYLTAAFYDEKGADLVRAGVVTFDEPDYINADPRLDELAAAGDEWAVTEKARRLRERIRWAAPEAAVATVVQRAKITASGMEVIGVNWCGGGTRKKMGRGGQTFDGDPIGDLEPSKTAQTRARRRAWVQIADVLPGYATRVRPIELAAENAVPVAVIEAAKTERKALPAHYMDSPPLANQADGYGYEGAGSSDTVVPVEVTRAAVERQVDPMEAGASELPLDDRRAEPQRQNAQEL